MNERGILVHIVVWNEVTPAFDKVIESILDACQNFPNSSVEITDNGSCPSTAQTLREFVSRFPAVKLYRNESNLGFCGAHNQAVSRFLCSTLDHILVLNPDTRLTPEAIDHLVEALHSTPGAELATPKILRCDESLAALAPPIIDAAGMEFFSSFRHFDRGGGTIDRGQYNGRELVFGGTGACLLVSRQGVERLLLPRLSSSDGVLLALYPQLAEGLETRAQLFDEAFFAYREDADLAMRAATLGIRCVYEPAALVFHVRRVTPERRAELPSELNRLSVRNRFLLQMNHWNWSWPLRVWVHGLIIRNVLVVLGVILREHSSFSGLWEAVRLAPRAFEQRSALRRKTQNTALARLHERT